ADARRVQLCHLWTGARRRARMVRDDRTLPARSRAAAHPVLMGEDTSQNGIVFTDAASGALRARRYRITVVSGPDAGKSREVEGGTVLVGSHQNNDLQIADKGVSRYHLELQLRAEGLVVKDLDSTNGTFQGSTRLQQAVILGSSRLRLGSNTEIEIAP